MKIQLIATIIAGTLAAGCATSQPHSFARNTEWSDLARDDNKCTDIIAMGGGIIKFCQTETSLAVYESGVDLSAERRRLEMINDPKALLALQKNVSARLDLKESRKLVAKACSVNDATYVTISLKSLKQIITAAKSYAPDEVNETGATQDVKANSQPSAGNHIPQNVQHSDSSASADFGALN